jgi:hypothetical protein
VLLDFTGGTLSLIQLFFDAWQLEDFSGVMGDPVKLGLAACSMVFDVGFMLQHYVFYRKNNRRLEEEEARLKEVASPPTDSINAPLLGQNGSGDIESFESVSSATSLGTFESSASLVDQQGEVEWY